MEKIDPKDQLKIRKMMLDNILYTDMTKHGQLIQDLKALALKEDLPV